MVRNNIKIYARIKQERSREALAPYEITSKKEHDYLIIRNPVSTEECPKATYKFSNPKYTILTQRCLYCLGATMNTFLNIFDQCSSQLDVYETIAKPIVNSVLNGFNATIFAYGQTGSGKTYAITGSAKDYSHRGIIPRSIEHVFEHAETNPHKFTIYISYLEIYNEAGYDLLSGKHRPATHVEDLPKVVLLADGKGDYHLRNLSIHPVDTVQDAMGLLFMGDSNRTIVETPMNDFSSRSHCVFTLYMSSLGDEGIIRRSKLHLVDLAGSERVYKSRVTGQTLTEAKYINLSLHYLEQVIVALSESKRPHVPFRNSMMTYMLKDSLAGNCLTSMLTTISVNLRDIQETIATCKFAQRVSMVNTSPRINEDVDIQSQLDFLRRENVELRRQLCSMRTTSPQEHKNLGLADEKYCKLQVQKFLGDSNNAGILDVRNYSEVEMCFSLMRKMYQKEKAVRQKARSAETTSRELINKYKTLVNQKDEEIFLNELVETLSRNSTYSLNLRNAVTKKVESPLSENELFRAFTLDPKNRQEIDHYNNAIRAQYTIAKQLSEVIENYRTDIRQLKQKLGKEAVKYDEETKVQMNTNLMNLVGCYLQTLLKIKNIKLKTDDLKHGLELAQNKLRENFKKCVQNNNVVPETVSYQNVFLTSREDITNLKSSSFHEDASSSGKIITPRTRKNSIDSIGSFIYKDIEDVSPTKDDSPNLYQVVSNVKDKNQNLQEITNCIRDKSPNAYQITSRVKDQSIQSLYQLTSQTTTCDLESRDTFDQDRISSLNFDRFGIYTNVSKNHNCTKTEIVKEASFGRRNHVLSLNDDKSPDETKVDDYVSRMEEEVYCESLASHASGKTAGQHGYHHENEASLSEVNQVIETMLVETDNCVRDSSIDDQKPKELGKKSRGHRKKPANRKESSFREVHQDNPIQDLIDRESLPTQVCDRDFFSTSLCETKISIPVVKRECPTRKAVVTLEHDSDTEEFKEFMKAVPLTGDPEVDEEIYSFYRDKFKS